MILVTGSTGFVGRHLIPALLEAGYGVRLLLPAHEAHADRLPWGGSLPVELVGGALSDPDVLREALYGVHTVIHLASAQWWGGSSDLERIDIEGTQAVIEAAQAARIGRLIVMSHLGAAPSSAYALLRSKGQVESLVQNSGLPYTIVRCGVIFGEQDRFVNGLAMLLRTNPLLFIQPGQGETLLHPLYIHDLVRALVDSLDNLDTVDRVLALGGPEYLTFNQMVRTVMRVTHAPRLIISLPPYTVRFFTRVLGNLFRRWPATTQWFDLLAENRTASLNSMSDLYGIKPVRFEDTLVQYMQGRRYTFELLRFLFRRRRPRGF